MDLIVPHSPNPVLVCSSPITTNRNLFALTTQHSSKTLRRKLNIRASASSAGPGGADESSWSIIYRSFRNGSKRFWVKFGELVKEETGFDLEDCNAKVGESVGRVRNELGSPGTTHWVSEFVDWNRWQRWKGVE